MAEITTDGPDVVMRMSAHEAEDVAWSLNYHARHASFSLIGNTKEFDVAQELYDIAEKAEDYWERPSLVIGVVRR